MKAEHFIFREETIFVIFSATLAFLSSLVFIIDKVALYVVKEPSPILTVVAIKILIMIINLLERGIQKHHKLGA